MHNKRLSYALHIVDVETTKGWLSPATARCTAQAHPTPALAKAIREQKQLREVQR
jgi:hypothetical protein